VSVLRAAKTAKNADKLLHGMDNQVLARICVLAFFFSNLEITIEELFQKIQRYEDAIALRINISDSNKTLFQQIFTK
jgi:hypothetical protein